MDLIALLDEFRDVYLPARNFAELTCTNYIRAVRLFLRWLDARGIERIDRVDLPMLNAYLAHLDGRGLAGTTRRQYAYGLKMWFCYLADHNHIAHNPAEHLRPPLTEQRDPRFLNEREIAALREALRYGAPRSQQVRDAAIVELLLQTGLRLSELCRLTMRDVELPRRASAEWEDAGELWIRQGKGRKDRRVKLNYKACAVLVAYKEVRPVSAKSPALFLNKYQKPLTPRAVQKLIEKYLDGAGIAGASVHSLRHTFGTQHALKGTQPRSIQEMMGHKSIATTGRYISLVEEQMARDVQRNAL